MNGLTRVDYARLSDTFVEWRYTEVDGRRIYDLGKYVKVAPDPDALLFEESDPPPKVKEKAPRRSIIGLVVKYLTEHEAATAPEIAEAIGSKGEIVTMSMKRDGRFTKIGNVRRPNSTKPVALWKIK